MSVGQCLALRPTVLGLVVAGGFGLLASGVVVRRRRMRASSAFAPLAIAAILAVLSLAAAQHGLGFPASRPLLAALVTLPPGVAVTITTVELASDDLTAVADWWAFVAGQLLLYTAGIVVAGELGGLLGRAALPDQHADILGGGPPWLGMFVFVVASSLYFRSPGNMIDIQLRPVLLGRGRRLFDGLPAEHTELELVRTLEDPGVLHLRYVVCK